MVVCDDHDFSRDMIGYDLRRNESITTEYRRRFAPNMYTKVTLIYCIDRRRIKHLSYFTGSKKNNQKT